MYPTRGSRRDPLGFRILSAVHLLRGRALSDFRGLVEPQRDIHKSHTRTEGSTRSTKSGGFPCLQLARAPLQGRRPGRLRVVCADGFIRGQAVRELAAGDVALA